jgi:rRNA small subunit methyltransferase G
MRPDRIAELLAPFLAPQGRSDQLAVLSPTQLQDISTYIDILLKWNAHINLTAIRDPEDIVPRHFGESLFAARSLFPVGYPVSSVPSVLKNFRIYPGARIPAAGSLHAGDHAAGSAEDTAFRSYQPAHE